MDFDKINQILGLKTTPGLPIAELERDGDKLLILELEGPHSVSLFWVKVNTYPYERLNPQILLDDITYVVYLEDEVKFESIGRDIINLLEISKSGMCQLMLGLDPKDYHPTWADKRVSTDSYKA
jgi:hypothetical protein